MDSGGHWTQITHFEDGIAAVKFGDGDALYLLSRKNAPRGQILRLPLAHLDLAQAKVVVAQNSGSGSDETARASIEDFVPAAGHLYVVDIMGGPSRIRVFDENGRALPAPPLPPISSVGEVLSVGGGDVLFFTSTYLNPPGWYRFDAASGKSVRTALYETSPINFDDAEVVREFAVSKDGTRVPMNIVHRKGTKLGWRQANDPVRIWRLQHQRKAVFYRIQRPHLARSGRSLRLCQSPGRRRIRRRMAPGGEFNAQAECLRRLHFLRPTPDRAQVHVARAPRHPRRKQRRPADGRGPHAAA